MNTQPTPTPCVAAHHEWAKRLAQQLGCTYDPNPPRTPANAAMSSAINRFTPSQWIQAQRYRAAMMAEFNVRRPTPTGEPTP